MLIFVGSHTTDPVFLEHVDEIRGLVDELEEHAIVETPSSADVLLFVESPENKFRRWATVLRSDPVVMENLDRAFVRDGTDRPIPFLPGLFFGMPRSRFDPATMVAMGAWLELSEEVRAQVEVEAAPEPRFLFSFRGYPSHATRRAITQLDTPETPVTLTTRFWDFDLAEQFRTDYLVELKNSAFVLCPRGLSPSTLRLYESMELGRVPVILSDEWVSPPGPHWEDFSLRVPEQDFAHLPELLRSLEADAGEMGRLARAAWEEWFRPGSHAVSTWIDGIRRLIEQRPPDWSPDSISRSWRSPAFQWRHGIHPAQGAMARARSLAARR